ncbi:MAG: hypothetical protein R2912_03145 [Eubacteriales bacterium]
MKKRVIAALICISCLVLVLSACSPRLVGEAKAKEAGLALINQAFEIDLADAVVTVAYQERAGVTYEDGYTIQYGTEEPDRVYVVKVNPDESGNAEYYTEVNALTGVAYRAEKAWELLKPMTAAQQARADELYSQDEI